MSKRRETELLFYRFLDWLSAVIAWFLFFRYRRRVEEVDIGILELFQDSKLIVGLLVVPFAWLILYSVFDKYQDIYRYSRLATLRRTFILSFIGVVVLFFTIMVDDTTYKYTSYWQPFLRLFSLHFFITVIFRMLFLTWAKYRLMSGSVSYKTLMIGNDSSALQLYVNFEKQDHKFGHNIIGYLDANGSTENKLKEKLQSFGTVDKLHDVLEEEEIEDVIIAIETTDHKKINGILQQLYGYRDTVNVKIIPDMYDIMIGKVKMNHIYDAGLIEIDQKLMPNYERIAKRLMDIFVSLFALILLIPLYLFIIIKVRLSSSGPIFYRQKRIGRNGKIFRIIKFRSMYDNAEMKGPQLSSDNDSRITPWGMVMRKYRLDELPQFYNVLVGEMSLVGPRPERQYYIDKITDTEPLYSKLLKVRPGITSWGQVKYGYASDVDEMIRRMKFDLIYLENMSILLDVKIMIFTVLILFQGKGK